MKLYEEFLDDDRLNEDYGKQAAENQEKIQRVGERMESVSRRVEELNRAAQNYKEKSGKTKDDISKAVYEMKIQSNTARKNSYMAYMQYLKMMQTYYQVKAREIEARSKAAERRKV